MRIILNWNQTCVWLTNTKQWNRTKKKANMPREYNNKKKRINKFSAMKECLYCRYLLIAMKEMLNRAYVYTCQLIWLSMMTLFCVWCEMSWERVSMFAIRLCECVNDDWGKNWLRAFEAQLYRIQSGKNNQQQIKLK